MTEKIFRWIIVKIKGWRTAIVQHPTYRCTEKYLLPFEGPESMTSLTQKHREIAHAIWFQYCHSAISTEKIAKLIANAFPEHQPEREVIIDGIPKEKIGGQWVWRPAGEVLGNYLIGFNEGVIEGEKIAYLTIIKKEEEIAKIQYQLVSLIEERDKLIEALTEIKTLNEQAYGNSSFHKRIERLAQKALAVHEERVKNK